VTKRNTSKTITEILLERFDDYIIQTCRRQFKNFHDADDLAQEVRIALLKKEDFVFDEDNKFKAWIKRTARYIASNTYQKTKKIKFSPENDLENAEKLIELFDYSVDCSREEYYEKVNTALALLPDQQQTAIKLRYGEDMKYKNIAKMMDISVNDVGQYIKRGLDSLEHSLRGDFHDYL